MNILNDTLIVRYDDSLKSIVIDHPDTAEIPNPLVRIRAETLDKMSVLEASQFLGERLILLIPQLRERYKADLARLAGNRS